MIIKWNVASALWKYMVALKMMTNGIKMKYFYVCLVISFLTISLYYLKEYETKSINFEEYNKQSYQVDPDPHPDIDCVFPKLSPFSEIAMKYNRDLPKIVCKGDDWVQCNMSTCQVKKEILDKIKFIVCYYKDIVHINDYSYEISNPVVVHDHGVYRLNRSDYFKVSCIAYNKTRFSDSANRWHGYISGLRPVQRRVPPPGRENSVNILMVGFDSTSHHSFLRKLPKSYGFLTKELEAVVLKGYNILGVGTAAALFPILSGRTQEEHPYAIKGLSNNEFLDSELFIFHTAKKDGYETVYYEDMPWIGTFQYRFNGFLKQPADHYLRSFLMEESKSGYKWLNGHKRKYCVGSSPQYLFMLNMTRQFMNLDRKRFCFTFISDISHDDNNVLGTADDDLVDFLRHMKESGKLVNTLLIVMGDHGFRFGDIRETYQGKVEERMPFMSFVLPKSLKTQRPNALESLRSNVEVLTTPFDIHTTILDAMGLKHLANNYTVPTFALTRGLSLFEPIPKSRKCDEAGIQPFWCVCVNNKWYQINSIDPFHNMTANNLVEYINNITQDTRSLCAERKLVSIYWVSKRRSEDSNDLASNDYYQTMVLLSPGTAFYEALMQYDKKINKFIIFETSISRISAYGNEPACVSATHPHLNKYCYCIDRL